MRLRFRADDWFYCLMWYFLRFWLRLLFRMEARGLENIPMSGPLIVAPNHFSYLDPPVVGCASHRPMRFMGKAELFRNRFIAMVLRGVHGFPVQRGTADLAAIRTALAELKKGEATLMFPEGGRNNGTALRPPNMGVALLAKMSGAKVMPVGVIGTEKAWPRGKKPRLAKIMVIFGKPLDYAEATQGMSEKEARDRFGWIVMEAIQSLLREGGLEMEIVDQPELTTAQ